MQRLGVFGVISTPGHPLMEDANPVANSASAVLVRNLTPMLTHLPQHGEKGKQNFHHTTPTANHPHNTPGYQRFCGRYKSGRMYDTVYLNAGKGASKPSTFGRGIR